MVTTQEDISGVLTEHVGPMIAMHGGAIELLNYDVETGNVHVKLSGSCAGCSASVFTLKIGVENTLMSFFPGDVTSVSHEEGEIVHPYY
jgi:Fe-S cluster biogenesis protein NfuA